jgi:hypothetical protein
LTSLSASLLLLLILIIRHTQVDVPRLASLKTWLGIAIVIWIIGEISMLLGWSTTVARVIHTVSMLLFPVILLVKARRLLWRGGR